MEGDRDLVPVQPSLLVPAAAPRPLPIVEGRERAKRAKRSSMPGAPADDAAAVSAPPVLAKRAVPATHKQQQKKKKKKKPKAKTVKSGSGKSRRRPSTKLINGSKSATGSAFFAYCFDEEMTLRRKNVDWGLGPDLVILETGVNDVWPGGERATRDFEKLLRTLRSLPSKPAVIALEAASLLLASTASMSSNAEYDHLPAAHFYDVPVLSAKQALFGSVAGLSPSDPTADPSSSPNSPVSKIDDLFLPDLHHPNERGHELLADVLISFLEQQACLAQSELLTVADARIRASSSRSLRRPRAKTRRTGSTRRSTFRRERQRRCARCLHEASSRPLRSTRRAARRKSGGSSPRRGAFRSATPRRPPSRSRTAGGASSRGRATSSTSSRMSRARASRFGSRSARGEPSWPTGCTRGSTTWATSQSVRPRLSSFRWHSSLHRLTSTLCTRSSPPCRPRWRQVQGGKARRLLGLGMVDRRSDRGLHGRRCRAARGHVRGPRRERVVAPVAQDQLSPDRTHHDVRGRTRWKDAQADARGPSWALRYGGCTRGCSRVPPRMARWVESVLFLATADLSSVQALARGSAASAD